MAAKPTALFSTAALATACPTNDSVKHQLCPLFITEHLINLPFKFDFN